MDSSLYRNIFLVALGVVAGCRSQEDQSQTTATGVAQSAQAGQGSADFLSRARRAFELGELQTASRLVKQALIEDPDSEIVKLAVCGIEQARGNHETVIDLAGSIDLNSRLGKAAVEMRYQSLLQSGAPNQAAEAMLNAVEAKPQIWRWRREAWRILNRLGRRQEASAQADLLCRRGAITQQELFSLLRRNDSFPYSLGSEPPERFFEPGLGLARWHFGRQEHGLALQQLAEEYRTGFPTAAAGALYGRILAETQAYEQLPIWRAKCDARVQRHSDYWSALGTALLDQHEFEASARALLEAIVRDWTDDDTAHRLGKVFDALGRTEDAELFRQRAQAISHLSRSTERLIRTSGNPMIRRDIFDKLMELKRPFEALQWSLSLIPVDQVARRRAIESKRLELLDNRSALTMAVESSLVGVDPGEFDIEPAIAELRGNVAARIPTEAPAELLANPRLVNVAEQVGLRFQWYPDVQFDLSSIPLHETVGGGIGVIDYDLDGWPDVYAAQGSGDPPTDRCTRSSVLFRNLGGKFNEITSRAQAEDLNYSSGIAVGDVNQDGFADLFLGSLGHNRMLINNGDGTFQDATHRLGEVGDRFTTSLAIADINDDALPDLFEANHVEMEGGFRLPDRDAEGRERMPSPLDFPAQSDRWFEGLPDGSYVAHEIGSHVAPAGTSYGVVVTDFDADGINEVFVANDARPNHFLRQAGNNQFRNVADAIGVANGFRGEANACMGVASGDFDRNGRLDLSVTNFWNEPANHFLQLSPGVFTDYAVRCRVDSLTTRYVGFGTKAVDIDHNGWLDLIVSNGHVFDMRDDGQEFQMPAQVLVNLGSHFEQAKMEDDSGYWNQAFVGRAMARIDFDSDGAIDLLIGHLDQPMALLHNQTSSPGNWIGFELIGTTSERDAVGARAVISVGNQQQTEWVDAGDGYLASDQGVLDFGTGIEDQIEAVEIHWPSGLHQVFEGLPAGHRYLVVEGEEEVYPRFTSDLTGSAGP